VGGRARALRTISLAVCVGASSVLAAGGSGGPAVALGDSLADAREAAASSGRPIVVIFGAVWCPVCREMRDVTLRAPEVTALADAFEWVGIDVDRNLSLAVEYGVEATPTLLVLAPDGTPVRKVVGGPAPERLAEILAAAQALVASGRSVLDDSDGGFDHRDITITPDGFRGTSICFSHVGYGPLMLRSQSPFQSLRLALAPRAPSTLARGQWEVRAATTWANVWAVEEAVFDPGDGEFGEYMLDYESLHVALAAAYGLSDTFQVEVGVEDRSVFGGVMDGFIEGFHDLFGIDQSGRDLWPRDQLAIRLDTPGLPRVVLDAANGGTFVRDLLLTVQHNVTCGTESWPALSWSVTGRYALKADLQEGDSFDVGASLAVSRRFGDVYSYLVLGYAWYGDDSAIGLELANTQATALAAVEWRFRPRSSLVIQWLWSQAATEVLSPFDESSNEVTLGWKWEVVPSGVLEVGLIENVITFDNSPDFGVHAAWTQRF